MKITFYALLFLRMSLVKSNAYTARTTTLDDNNPSATNVLMQQQYDLRGTKQIKQNVNVSLDKKNIHEEVNVNTRHHGHHNQDTILDTSAIEGDETSIDHYHNDDGSYDTTIRKDLIPQTTPLFSSSTSSTVRRKLTAPYYWKKVGKGFPGIEPFLNPGSSGSYYHTYARHHVSLSKNGKIVAHGYKIDWHGRGTTYYYSGVVQVYAYRPLIDKWAKLGPQIEGKGCVASLSSNGLVIAIGEWDSNVESEGGRVNMFKYNASSKSWNDYGVIENPLTGYSNDSLNRFWFGYSTALSDKGNVVAIGQPGQFIKDCYYFYSECVGNTSSKGRVFIYYHKSDGSWALKGDAIVGNDYDHYGRYISLSDDGNKLAISAKAKNSVVVYKFNSNTTPKKWEQVGQEINGIKGLVSISADGLTVEVRSEGDSYAQVFTYTSATNAWNQLQMDPSSWVIFSTEAQDSVSSKTIVTAIGTSTKFRIDGEYAVSGDGFTFATPDSVWKLTPMNTAGCDVNTPFSCPTSIKPYKKWNLCLEAVDSGSIPVISKPEGYSTSDSNNIYLRFYQCDIRKNSQLWTVDEYHQFHNVQTPDLCIAKNKNDSAIQLQKCVDGGSVLTQFFYQATKKTIAWKKDFSLVIQKVGSANGDYSVVTLKKRTTGLQTQKFNPVLSKPTCISNIPFQCPSAIQLKLNWGSFCIEPNSLTQGSDVLLKKCSSNSGQLFYKDKFNQFHSVNNPSLCLSRNQLSKKVKLRACTEWGSKETRFVYQQDYEKIILEDSMKTSNPKFIMVDGASAGRIVKADICSTTCQFSQWIPRVF